MNHCKLEHPRHASLSALKMTKPRPKWTGGRKRASHLPTTIYLFCRGNENVKFTDFLSSSFSSNFRKSTVVSNAILGIDWVYYCSHYSLQSTGNWWQKKYPAAKGRGQETESIYVRLSHFHINRLILNKQRIFHGFLKVFCLPLPLRENAEFTQNLIICYTELRKWRDVGC